MSHICNKIIYSNLAGRLFIPPSMKRSDFLRMSTLGAGAVLLPRNVYAAGIGTGTLSPYLSNPQPDSMWVSWWMDSNTQSFIDWGTDSNDFANCRILARATAITRGKSLGCKPPPCITTVFEPSRKIPRSIGLKPHPRRAQRPAVSACWC